MELPNRVIDGHYYYVDEDNNIMREATEEETKTLERTLIADALEQARRPLTESEVSRMLIAAQINTLTVDDSTALRMFSFYPAWVTDSAYVAGFKVKRNGDLYRCIQAHTGQTGWEPENAPALWEQICETHAGTLNDPVPYSGNMALNAGLHYVQDGVIYLCVRDTESAVYSSLAELVGIYLEEV